MRPMASGSDDNGDNNPPRQTKKTRTGYECDFVEPPPKQFQSECPICLQILREPYIVDCCGYSFCAACIERAGEDGTDRCPHCNQPGYATMINKGLKRSLNEFRGYCPHRLRGCKWVGELGKLDEHLNSDPQPQLQCQLEGCLFAVIECLHCKEGIRRDEIADHQLERCPQRPYTCEYCTEYKSNFEDVVHSHWPECKCFLLPCPSKCTHSGPCIERQQLDHHVKEECPLTIVRCELHHAGCEVTLPRKDLADHMKEDYVVHISLLTRELARTKQELTSQSHELTRTKQELTSQSHELTRTKQELTSQSRELTRTKQELTQKITFQSQGLTRVKTELYEAQRQAIDQFETQKGCDPRNLRIDVEMQCDVVPVTMKMVDYHMLKKNGTAWHSHPFYTGMGGHKMCLIVYANGYSMGKGTHVSVYTCFMRGDFDSQLKWPFQGDVTVGLLNQLEDNQHCIYTNQYTDTASDAVAARVTDGERSLRRGWRQFILHSELGLRVAQNRQYLKDNCLTFRIVSVRLN